MAGVSTKFYVTLPDSVAEELHNLGEYYQVGPATLASRILAGAIQPLAAAAIDRGPVNYAVGPPPAEPTAKEKLLAQLGYEAPG